MNEQKRRNALCKYLATKAVLSWEKVMRKGTGDVTKAALNLPTPPPPPHTHTHVSASANVAPQNIYFGN